MTALAGAAAGGVALIAAAENVFFYCAVNDDRGFAADRGCAGSGADETAAVDVAGVACAAANRAVARNGDLNVAGHYAAFAAAAAVDCRRCLRCCQPRRRLQW